MPPGVRFVRKAALCAQKARNPAEMAPSPSFPPPSTACGVSHLRRCNRCPSRFRTGGTRVCAALLPWPCHIGDLEYYGSTK